MRAPSLPVFALTAALALPAWAQEAAAPTDIVQRLTQRAAGVVGSGDRLALRLRGLDGAASSDLRPGDAFEGDWVLGDLTPSSATLVRPGETRTIGLNPTGALAGPSDEAPSLVLTTGVSAPPLAQAILDLTDEECATG